MSRRVDNCGEEPAESPSYKSNQIKLFTVLIEKTVDKICDGVTVEKFRSVFEDVPGLKQKPQKIYKLYSLFKQQVKTSIMNELQEMINEDDFDSKFCMLNKITKEADCSSDKTPAWRPSGNVTDDIRSHLLLVKLKQKAGLELYLKEKEVSVNHLINEVKVMRNKFEELDTKTSQLIIYSHNNADKLWKELSTLNNNTNL